MHFVSMSGTSVPAVGLGTWQMEGREAEDAVRDALAIGYRHIDTAQGYDNEVEIGSALLASGVGRDSLFLTTKTWIDDRSSVQIVRNVEDSLRRLRTPYLDLLLAHWPPRHDPLEPALETMFALQREGKVRHVGVSNFTCAQLDAAMRVGPIACNQIEFHPYIDQHASVARAQRDGVVITAYCPLARGKVTGDPTLGSIARRYGKSPAQVTLRWLLSKPGVCAVPKAASRQHRRLNLDVFDFVLAPNEMRAIDELARGERLLDPPWAPRWD